MTASNPQQRKVVDAGRGSRSLPRNVKLLGAASLLNDVASEMIFPLMPHFLVTVLGGNRFHLGIIEGVADSLSSVLKLWSGAWSDSMERRKPLVIFGYLLAAVARPLIGGASTPWHLFAARTADRIGKGIRTSPRDALIADSSLAEMRGRAFGFHRAMDHLGAAIGPICASLFLLAFPGQLRLLFIATLIPGIGVVCLLAFGLRDMPASGGVDRRPSFTLAPFTGSFRLYLVALVVFTLGNSSDAFLLMRAGELGVPTALLPLLWSAFHVVKSGANVLAGRLVDTLGPRPLIGIGWLAYAAVYLAFAFAGSAWTMWILFLAYGASFAMIEPAEKTLVVRLAGAQRGLAFGWFNLAVGIAALPSSLLFGWLYQRFGAGVAFGCGACLAFSATLILLQVRGDDATC